MNTVFSPNDGREIGEWKPIEANEIARHFECLTTIGMQTLQSIEERRAILERFVMEIDRESHLLAELVIDEVGKLPSEARDEIDYAIAFLQEYIRRLQMHAFSAPPLDGRRVLEDAVGIALLITPFNDPVAGLTRKIGPAVAAGCTFVLKPSPLGLLTAEAVMRCFERAGGNATGKLVMTDDGETIARLIAHEGIGIVSFTGSTATGRKVAMAAGSGLKKTVLELGGNCPMLVLPGADIDVAVNDLIARKVRAAGQACSSINRVFVHESIADDVFTLLAGKVMELCTGPARAQSTDFGPVRTPQSVDRLRSLQDRALRLGARILARGAAADAPASCLFPLTVVQAAENTTSALDREEAFGPLVEVRAIGSIEHAVAYIAQERHALAAYVYGADAGLKPQILARWRFGSIGFDTVRIQSPATPTGGFGLAGHGREGGTYGLREYLTTRNICEPL